MYSYNRNSDEFFGKELKVYNRPPGQAEAERVQNGIATLLHEGWIIIQKPCECGGPYMWLVPVESSKGFKEFGCVCHKTLDAINYCDANGGL